MRLLQLQDDGEFSLAEFFGDSIPPYAILSHTWGADADEVTFKDIAEGTGKNKAGYRKLSFCGRQAARDNLQYFWVDTCAIDKSSSAELSEAINSMFRWYQNAKRCYVYLSDVSGNIRDESGDSKPWMTAFKQSRWFTRGWTLQELLAPATVEFFSKEEHRLGDKHSLEQTLSGITGIAVTALRQSCTITSFPVDERMYWAATRQTKREEDTAYCLLGIFDIHMPLIYGEGRQKAMTRLRKEVTEASKDQSSITPSAILVTQQDQATSTTVPFHQDPDFVDRPSILTWVRKKCEAPAGRAALVGLGGVGKSQIAIQYCHETRAASSPPWVFWVHAGSPGRFEEGYRRIAEATKMEGWNSSKSDVLPLVRNWLCDESNGSWIMIIDNADDPNVFFPTSGGVGTVKGNQEEEPLSDFIPHSPNGSVLITSRNQDLAFRLAGSHSSIMEVKPMDEDNALALFQKKIGSSFERSDAIEVIHSLDFMPLAITQAAAYILQRAPRMTVSRYLAKIRSTDRDRARLLEEHVGDSRRDSRASNSIITTWQISFEYIRKEQPSAARLLSLMCLFDRQGIPESVLLNQYHKDDDNDDDDHDADFDDDIHTLNSFCLVRMNQDGSEFEMHRLVQYSTKQWLKLNKELEVWIHKYLKLLDTTFPDGKFENWTTCQKLFPHVEMVLEYKPKTEYYLKVWANILYKASWYTAKIGKYIVAESMGRLVLEIDEQTLGKEHRNTLRSIDNLSRIVTRLGKHEEAEKMQRQVLEGYEKLLGPEHQATLSKVTQLGSVLDSQGRHEEAEAMQRRALKGYEKMLGPEHQYTLTNVSELGAVLESQGRYEEAEVMQRRALKGFEKVLGPEHPHTLTSAGNLSLVLSYQGRLVEAEEIEVHVMETRKRVLGDEHPYTLTAMANLAYTRQRQGRKSEALELMGACAEARERVLGPNHPDTTASNRRVKDWQ